MTAETKQSHTPIPLILRLTAHASEIIFPDGLILRLDSFEKGKVQAAFIVRAVNAHEVFLKALQEIKMRGGVDGEIAREAITKAEAL